MNAETNLPEIDSSEAASIPREGLSEIEALDNTEVLFNLRETVQSFALSYFCDGDFSHTEQYEYNKEERRKLIKAWSRVIGHYSITVSPWVDVIINEAVCTGPMVALAYNNRTQRIELEKQRSQIIELQRQNEEFRRQQNQPPPPPTIRRDTKTAWKINESGCFTHTEGGTYIPKDQQTEKAPLTTEAYELLCKHNGKDFVDKVFKINS